MNKILVVDDEPSVCEALALGLASKEFHVDVAANGSGGVRLASGEDYDVLIVDLYLPDMDGIEVIQRVREKHPEIVSIVITAHYSKENFDEARRCGASAFIEKPFHMGFIRSAIARGLEERTLGRTRSKAGGKAHVGNLLQFL